MGSSVLIPYRRPYPKKAFVSKQIGDGYLVSLVVCPLNANQAGEGGIWPKDEFGEDRRSEGGSSLTMYLRGGFGFIYLRYYMSHRRAFKRICLAGT